MSLTPAMRVRIADFYREEFLRHRAQLEGRRPVIGEPAVDEVQAVLSRLIDDMERICEVENFEELASRMLHRIDVVSHLSASQAPTVPN